MVPSTLKIFIRFLTSGLNVFMNAGTVCCHLESDCFIF